jgi:hypothetical protein
LAAPVRRIRWHKSPGKFLSLKICRIIALKAAILFLEYVSLQSRAVAWSPFLANKLFPDALFYFSPRTFIRFIPARHACFWDNLQRGSWAMSSQALTRALLECCLAEGASWATRRVFFGETLGKLWGLGGVLYEL